MTAPLVVQQVVHVPLRLQATQRTHQVVLQYIELMKRLPVSELAQVLPKLSRLIQDFQIGAECAMSVYRPLLRLLCGLNMDTKLADEPVGEESGQTRGIIPLPGKERAVLGPITVDDEEGWASGVIEVPVEAEEGASDPHEAATGVSGDHVDVGCCCLDGTGHVAYLR